jgi:hypothetical protein
VLSSPVYVASDLRRHTSRPATTAHRDRPKQPPSVDPSFSPLITRHPPLSPLESALPQNNRVTRLESALPKSLDLKSFRIRTSKKWRGEGGKVLTRDQRTFMICHLFRIAGFALVMEPTPWFGLAWAAHSSTDCYLTYAKPQRNVPLVFPSVFLAVLSHDVSEDFRGLPRSSLANTAFWCVATGRAGGPIDLVNIPGQSPSQVKEGNHEPKGL